MDEKLKAALDDLCDEIVKPGINPKRRALLLQYIRVEWPGLYQSLINVISAYKPVNLKKQ